jgi:hypothetical protein
MNRRLAAVITVLAAATLTGCAMMVAEMTTPFTTENIMQVHAGMSSESVLKLFGPPRDVSFASCGAAVGKPWNCTTWDYKDEASNRASLTFASRDGGLVLNDYHIYR